MKINKVLLYAAETAYAYTVKSLKQLAVVPDIRLFNVCKYKPIQPALVIICYLRIRLMKLEFFAIFDI